MVKEMSKNQMTYITNLLADVIAQESCRNPEDNKRVGEIREMVQGTGPVTSGQAGKAIKDLKRLKVEGSNGSRSGDSGEITQRQIGEINRLRSRQDHVPDEIEERIRPLLKNFDLGKLGRDDADILIKLLGESRRPIPEDFNRSKPM